jgi:hypothetical protein
LLGFAPVFAARVISRTLERIRKEAMAAKTPLTIVKESFGEKAKLVDALEKLTGESLWVSRTNKDKGLAHVSNAKLLRLHATFTVVKEKFGTREKLIDAILEIEKASKDAGYKQKLLAWPVPRLFDAYKSAAKRQARATASTKEAGAKAPSPKKAAAGAKAPPVKKAASAKKAAKTPRA